MNIKQSFDTKNKTKGVNSKKFIIVHHTGTGEGTIRGVINGLTTGKGKSCHYIIDTNGDTYKIGNDSDILWHAGLSSWGKYKALNPVSIGIEVIGPLADGFTFEQKLKTRELVKELMGMYNIPKKNILRHADISPGRKVDIDLRFLNDSKGNRKYKSWEDWQNSL